jgi:hypothetical protein
VSAQLFPATATTCAAPKCLWQLEFCLNVFCAFGSTFVCSCTNMPPLNPLRTPPLSCHTRRAALMDCVKRPWALMCSHARRTSTSANTCSRREIHIRCLRCVGLVVTCNLCSRMDELHVIRSKALDKWSGDELVVHFFQ